MATRVLQLTLTMTEWAGNLGACIKLQTVSWNETSQNVAELQEMGRFLRRTFPVVFSAKFVQVGGKIWCLGLHRESRFHGFY